MNTLQALKRIHAGEQQGESLVDAPMLDAAAQVATGAGALVPVGDSLALAAAVEHLVGDDARRAELGEAAGWTGRAGFNCSLSIAGGVAMDSLMISILSVLS